MKRWMKWSMALAAAGIVAVGLSSKVGAEEVPEPPYEVLEQHEVFEVRRYGPGMVAETDMEGPWQASLNGGFRILAGYIFGGNQAGQEIPMTAPVNCEEVGQGRRVTFFMPEGHDAGTLPTPNDPRVRLREVPARVVAVHRFSGWAGEKTFRTKTERLQEALDEAGFRTVGPPVLAQYNPPWTLPHERRNEVMIEIER